MSTFVPAWQAAPGKQVLPNVVGQSADHRGFFRRGVTWLFQLVQRFPAGVLGLFALILVGLVWTTVGLQVRSEKEQVLRDAYRDSANLVRVFEEHTVRTMKNVDQAVLFVKYQYERNAGRVDIADAMRQGMINGRIFNQIGVIDEHGIYILSNLPDFKRVDLSDREHFKVHVADDSRQLFISKPVLGRASGKWSLQMTRRINKPDGSFGGVVVVSVDPFYFFGVLWGARYRERGRDHPGWH